MTRQSFRRSVLLVTLLYGLAIILGIVLRIVDRSGTANIYATFRDLIPLIIALPAAHLAYVFQRRAAYLAALRHMWDDLVTAVQTARLFALVGGHTESARTEALQRLTTAIDKLRGMFDNIPVAGTAKGWYPWEPLRQIYKLIESTRDIAPYPRDPQLAQRIHDLWTPLRDEFLKELDREVPVFHHAEYVPSDPRA